MKIILFLHMAAVLLVSCSSLSSKDEVKEFIPGTYIRFSEHEFGKEYDTLVISLQNKTANEYKILRKWKYDRKEEGAEYKRIITAGIYYPQDKVVEDMETGDLLSFDTKDKSLFIGTLKYKKL